MSIQAYHSAQTNPSRLVRWALAFHSSSQKRPQRGQFGSDSAVATRIVAFACRKSALMCCGRLDVVQVLNLLYSICDIGGFLFRASQRSKMTIRWIVDEATIPMATQWNPLATQSAFLVSPIQILKLNCPEECPFLLTLPNESTNLNKKGAHCKCEFRRKNKFERRGRLTLNPIHPFRTYCRPLNIALKRTQR